MRGCSICILSQEHQTINTVPKTIRKKVIGNSTQNSTYDRWYKNGFQKQHILLAHNYVVMNISHTHGAYALHTFVNLK